MLSSFQMFLLQITLKCQRILIYERWTPLSMMSWTSLVLGLIPATIQPIRSQMRLVYVIKYLCIRYLAAGHVNLTPWGFACAINYCACAISFLQECVTWLNLCNNILDVKVIRMAYGLTRLLAPLMAAPFSITVKCQSLY